MLTLTDLGHAIEGEVNFRKRETAMDPSQDQMEVGEGGEHATTHFGGLHDAPGRPKGQDRFEGGDREGVHQMGLVGVVEDLVKGNQVGVTRDGPGSQLRTGDG